MQAILNNRPIAAVGDPSRTADDNVRASVMFKRWDADCWLIGMGGRTGAGYTPDELSRWNLIGNDFMGGSGLTTVWSIEKDTGVVSWDTGDWDITFRAGFTASMNWNTPDNRQLTHLMGNLNNTVQWTVGTGATSTDPAYRLAINGSTKWDFLRDGRLVPATDNTLDIGAGSLRIKEIFAAVGAINTSDAREKANIIDASDDEAALRAIRKVRFRRYQWREAIEQKGEGGARLHFGVIAQEVKEAFESEGVDPFRYGLLCHDEWEGGDRYGVRMDELLALKLAAL